MFLGIIILLFSGLVFGDEMIFSESPFYAGELKTIFLSEPCTIRVVDGFNNVVYENDKLLEAHNLVIADDGFYKIVSDGCGSKVLSVVERPFFSKVWIIIKDWWRGLW